METVYDNLVIPSLTGNIRNDIYSFLVRNHCSQTAEHCMKVGEEAGKIARRYGYHDPEAAEYAGYLHDISAVFPNEIRIRVSERLGIEVLPEERTFPMIIHQKISKAMARQLFQIEEDAILNAVGCHTTLRKGAGELDKILFVADKIEWDQSGTPPYLHHIVQQMEISLNHAAFAYIRYLWDQRDKLRVVHPWLAEAYEELGSCIEAAR